jgi:hypothetical protein
VGSLRAATRALLPREQAESEAKRVTRELQKDLTEIGPYGPVLDRLELESVKVGERVFLDFVNPLALLWRLGRQQAAFAAFLAASLRGGVGRVVLSADEVRPGNPLRPDAGRLYQAIYFTFMEFPPWWRSSTHGWLTLMIAPVKRLKVVAGGFAKVFESLVARLWRDPMQGPSLGPLGVRIPYGDNTTDVYHLRGDLTAILGDEKSLKEIASGKGSSGLKPCLRCMNVLSRTEEQDLAETNLVLISEGDPSKFKQWTLANVERACRRLEASFATETRQKHSELEKRLGLNYNTHGGLLWGPLRQLSRLPLSLYYDSMHCLQASGGIASVECNLFLVMLVQDGFKDSIEQLKDRFVAPGGGADFEALLAEGPPGECSKRSLARACA